MVFVVPKGIADKNLLDLLKDILKNDMMIIMSGLGFIGLESIGQAFVESSKNRNSGFDMYDMGMPSNTHISE